MLYFIAFELEELALAGNFSQTSLVDESLFLLFLFLDIFLFLGRSGDG